MTRTALRKLTPDELERVRVFREYLLDVVIPAAQDRDQARYRALPGLANAARRRA